MAGASATWFPPPSFRWHWVQSAKSSCPRATTSGDGGGLVGEGAAAAAGAAGAAAGAAGSSSAETENASSAATSAAETNLRGAMGILRCLDATGRPGGGRASAGELAHSGGVLKLPFHETAPGAQR